MARVVTIGIIALGVVLALAVAFAVVDYVLQRALRAQIAHHKAVAAEARAELATARTEIASHDTAREAALSYIAGIPDRTLTPLELATHRRELIEVMSGLRR